MPKAERIKKEVPVDEAGNPIKRKPGRQPGSRKALLGKKTLRIGAPKKPEVSTKDEPVSSLCAGNDDEVKPLPEFVEGTDAKALTEKKLAKILKKSKSKDKVKGKDQDKDTKEDSKDKPKSKRHQQARQSRDSRGESIEPEAAKPVRAPQESDTEDEEAESR